MIEVVVAKEVQIDLRQDIDAGILSIAVTKDENGGIDDQEANDHRNRIFMVAEQGKERHDAIAECNALHDSPDAEVTKTE